MVLGQKKNDFWGERVRDHIFWGKMRVFSLKFMILIKKISVF